MTERRLMFLDIEPKSNSSISVSGEADKPLWSHSENTFSFNFLPDNLPASLPGERTDSAESGLSFTGQGPAFAFNFQIPPATPVEHMETTETPYTSNSGSQGVQEEKPSLLQEVSSPPEPLVKSKAKKKSRRNKPSDNSESKKKASSADGTQEVLNTELSSEEQLNRQLDWCIEQLELGMRSQKGTPKQKEEASRALKTLRSSKAPLVKKRQVMRAMTGDYREKMEEEKKRQHKLIQSELASAQVKVVSDSPKKCVFHRRAGVKPQTLATEETLQQPEAQTPQTQGDVSAFVFTPSKEEFRFNFL